MLCASIQLAHSMLYLLVHDQSYYKCLAQLPLSCHTIGLPLAIRCKAINFVTVTEIPVQLEPMMVRSYAHHMHFLLFTCTLSDS